MIPFTDKVCSKKSVKQRQTLSTRSCMGCLQDQIPCERTSGLVEWITTGEEYNRGQIQGTRIHSYGQSGNFCYLRTSRHDHHLPYPLRPTVIPFTKSMLSGFTNG